MDWLAHYERKHLPGDALAGVSVATLLIPQAMAYALLAGLPPQVGLYASLLPLAVYALLGSSRFQSVGPSALLSLLIVTQVAALADPGSPRYLAFAMVTALIVGVMQSTMGFARLGVLTNFLSQPVLSGFTSAAACLIALSQVKHLLGVPLPPTHHLHELLGELARAVPQIHWPTVAISTASVLLLLALQTLLPRVLAQWKTLPAALAQSLSKSGPIVVLIAGTAIAAAFHLGARNAINFIDASALETLTDLRTHLQDAGIELYLSEVKGPVMDRLAHTEFFEQLGTARAFLSTEEAYEQLATPNPQEIAEMQVLIAELEAKK
jgi:SulP family sulfate permease